MTNDVKTMFDSIKESLSNEKKGAGNRAFKDFLKMEAGKTYLVRLVPNIASPKDTFFHYSHHGWESLATGQYVQGTCLKTIGERCPICEARFKLYKTKNPDDKALAYIIRPFEKHMVNVYVISDPTTPENEGTVKVLNFGKRVYEKILEATEGSDADEFGHRVYDLSENGCNFKIKVESSSDSPGGKKFQNYNNSRFTAPSAIPNMTAEKIQEIYNNTFDLSKMIEMKSEDELTAMLNTHFFVDKNVMAEKAKSSQPRSTPEAKNAPTDKEDDLPMSYADSKPVPKAAAPKPVDTSAKTSSHDEKIKNLLTDLDKL